MMIPRLFSAVFSLLISPLSAAPPDGPTNLRVNDVENPVGTGSGIWFGWHVNDPDPDEIQSAWQIVVASSAETLAAGEGDVWDSGKVEGRAQNHIAFGGKAESDRELHWKVRTWDKDGNVGAWSGPARFVVGLLENADWDGARWIRRDSAEADDHTYYRKAFELPDKPLARGTIYVSAVHKYALHLNGRPVGKGPAYHHPRYQYYNAFDITPLLKAGPNQLALFQHWFGGGQGRPESARGAIAKAVVHFRDGSTIEIGTDSSWKQTRAEAWIGGQEHRNRGEGVGYVEKIDARKLIPDWTSTAFDDSSWQPAAVIGPQPTEPWTGTLAPDLTRIEETVVSPASVRRKGDIWTVDLGKIMAGVPRITFKGGEAGTVVDMLGGYSLDSSGRIDPTLNQNTDLGFHAVLDGGSFTFEPAEYVGMRYLEIRKPPMEITKDNFRFVARHSRLDGGASFFESSDDTLNEVWALMKHSLFTCAHEAFVDTPTREKGGFLGDAAIQSTVAMPVLNERPLTQRSLREFLQSMEQHWSAPADRGRMNAVYPNNDGGRDIPDFTQAYLPWVWAYYMETGDRAFLEANWPKLADIGGYISRHIDGETGLVTRLTGGSGPYEHGIIDWPATMRYGYDMETAARTVINAWGCAGFDILARIAAELGKAAESDGWRARADALEAAMNNRLRNAGGLYIDGLAASGEPSAHVSQHANMFPLALGMVPAEHAGAVTAKVKELRMKVGMVTVMWLVRALGEAGEGAALVDLYTNPAQPGWARCLNRGATATWESWDAEETRQSLSHAWGAAGLDGYVRYILGIRPLKPQYDEVLIQPLDFGDSLTYAKGRIATDRGPLAVDWRRKDGSIRMTLEIPVNVVAQVSLPRGKSDRPIVLLDGDPAPHTIENDRIVISGVGSGSHSILRRDAPRD